jgi:hypothetical protein
MACQKSLRHLSFTNCNIDAAFPVLALALPSLSELIIASDYLQHGMPFLHFLRNLSILDLRGTSAVWDDLATQVQLMRKLKSLRVDGLGNRMKERDRSGGFKRSNPLLQVHFS